MLHALAAQHSHILASCCHAWKVYLLDSQCGRRADLHHITWCKRLALVKLRANGQRGALVRMVRRRLLYNRTASTWALWIQHVGSGQQRRACAAAQKERMLHCQAKVLLERAIRCWRLVAWRWLGLRALLAQVIALLFQLAYDCVHPMYNLKDFARTLAAPAVDISVCASQLVH
jgi:hypothetical protein